MFVSASILQPIEFNWHCPAHFDEGYTGTHIWTNLAAELSSNQFWWRIRILVTDWAHLGSLIEDRLGVLALAAFSFRKSVTQRTVLPLLGMMIVGNACSWSHGFKKIFVAQASTHFFETLGLRIGNRRRFTINRVSIVFEVQINFLFLVFLQYSVEKDFMSLHRARRVIACVERRSNGFAAQSHRPWLWP